MLAEIANQYIDATPRDEFELSLSVMRDQFPLNELEKAALILGRQFAERLASNWTRLDERISAAGNIPVLIGHTPSNRYNLWTNGHPDLDMALSTRANGIRLSYASGCYIPYDEGGGGGVTNAELYGMPSARVSIESPHALDYNHNERYQFHDRTLGNSVSWSFSADRPRGLILTAARAYPRYEVPAGEEPDEDDDYDYYDDQEVEDIWQEVNTVDPVYKASVSEIVPVLVGDQIAEHISLPSLWGEDGFGPMLQTSLRRLLASAIYIRAADEDDLADEYESRRGVGLDRFGPVNIMIDRPTRAIGGMSLLTVDNKPVTSSDERRHGKPAKDQYAFTLAHDFFMSAEHNDFSSEAARSEVEEALAIIASC